MKRFFIPLTLLSLLLLAACSDMTPEVAGSDGSREVSSFLFDINPNGEQVSVTAYSPEGVQAQALLDPETELLLTNATYTFGADNTLTITATFRNATADSDFLQPFIFLPVLSPRQGNYVSSSEPPITDAALGGDGFLAPNEATSTLTFTVEHKGERFTYRVNAYAEVEGTASTDVSFTVNSTLTDSDANPGNGVCETEVSNGVCTLTAAIEETNALRNRQTINVPAGVYIASSPRALPLLVITDALTIVGAGPELSVIARGPDERASIVIEAGASVEIRNIGILRRFVGIRNDGELLLINSSIAAEDDYGRVSTFGIINTGTATVFRSKVGEGQNVFSIGISNGGSLTVLESLITGNGAEGIVNGGTLRVEDSTIRQQGLDGILNFNGGEAIILRSAITDNGGGSEDCASGIGNSGTLTLINSTVSGSRTIFYGEGVCKGVGISNSGIVTLVNSTLEDNSDDEGPNNSIYNTGTVAFTNTIVANTLLGTECGGPGTFVSNGNNLASDGSCNLTQPSDLPNTDPLLGPLADNGGPTLTHALLPGSPAIDAGSDTGLATDQRGVPRPQSDAFDIGAYEAEVF